MIGEGRQAHTPKLTDLGTINDVALTPNFDKLAQSGVLSYQRFGQCAIMHPLPQFHSLRQELLGNWPRSHPAGCNLGHQHSNMAAFT